MSYVDFSNDCARLAKAAEVLADIVQQHTDFQDRTEFLRQIEEIKSLIGDVNSLAGALLPIRI
jgi:hypothetical protein